MREIYRHIETIAPLNEPVLILGETGTGKELVANEIHRCSGRPGELVSVNCAELTPDLLINELFGHTRGAYTSADQVRKGLMSEAGQGTFFLDEIGDLDLDAQAKLLRVLQERKFRSLGSNKLEDFRARLVLATHHDLEGDCDAQKFRRDLFARIRTFTLELAPLRERCADIPLLAHHIVKKFNSQYPDRRVQISPGSLNCLFQPDWPENVRELETVIWRAATYADQEKNINQVLLQEATGWRKNRKAQNTISFDPSSDTWRTVQRRALQAYLRALLTHTGGNIEAAIGISGLSRSQFYERRKKLEKGEEDRGDDKAR